MAAGRGLRRHMASTIGQDLKRARLAKTLSLEDVSHATKIPLAGLDAMERDDFTVFPNATYGRSFLNIYSRHLGVDASAAVAGMSQPKRRRRSRPDFLETDLRLASSDQTIPIVKHRIIELKPRRSLVGAVFFLLLALMLPSVYYLGKWAGLRERVPVQQAAAVPEEAAERAPVAPPRQPIRARVIAPAAKDPFGDAPVRVHVPDPEINALLGLDSPPPSPRHR